MHATVPCENGPSACVRLSRMTEPFAAPAVLIDERNRYTELSLDRLFYAVQWKDHLLLAGGSGIFDYDARLHSWKRHAAETISAIGPCAASSCFYYGYGGRSSGVALFAPRTMTGDAPSRWALAGEQPTRIAAEAPGKAAVLTAAGRAYALAPGSVSSLINPATSSPVPLDRYRGAVTFGDKVLFFGQPGALLHDIVRRSYSPLAAVPEWLRSPASIVAASGAFLFGLEPRGALYDAHVAPQQQVELGTLVFNTSKPFPIDGPIRAVDASSPDVLRVIDGNGRVQSIAASGVTPLTGGRVERHGRHPVARRRGNGGPARRLDRRRRAALLHANAVVERSAARAGRRARRRYRGGQGHVVRAVGSQSPGDGRRPPVGPHRRRRTDAAPTSRAMRVRQGRRSTCRGRGRSSATTCARAASRRAGRSTPPVPPRLPASSARSR